MIDYSTLSEEEKIELFDLRTAEQDVTNQYTFQVEIRPGVIKYNTISIGKKYKINRPDKKAAHNRVVEVLKFSYKKLKKDEPYDNEVPIGVIIKFTDRNVEGTYYDMLDLIELN